MTVHRVATLTQEPLGEGVPQGAHLQQQKEAQRARTLVTPGRVTRPTALCALDSPSQGPRD